MVSVFLLASDSGFAQTDSLGVNVQKYVEVEGASGASKKDPKYLDLVVHYGPQVASSRIQGRIEIRGNTANFVDWDFRPNVYKVPVQFAKDGKILIGVKEGHKVILAPAVECKDCAITEMEYEYHVNSIDEDRHDTIKITESDVPPQFVLERHKNVLVGLKGVTLENCDKLGKRCDQIKNACTAYAVSLQKESSTWPARRNVLDRQQEELTNRMKLLNERLTTISSKRLKAIAEKAEREGNLSERNFDVKSKGALKKTLAEVAQIKLESAQSKIDEAQKKIDGSNAIIQTANRRLDTNRLFNVFKFRTKKRRREEIRNPSVRVWQETIKNTEAEIITIKAEQAKLREEEVQIKKLADQAQAALKIAQDKYQEVEKEWKGVEGDFEALSKEIDKVGVELESLGQAANFDSQLEVINENLEMYRKSIQNVAALAGELEKCEKFEDIEYSQVRAREVKEELERLDSDLLNFEKYWKTEPKLSFESSLGKAKKGQKTLSFESASYHGKAVTTVIQSQCDDTLVRKEDGTVECEIVPSQSLSKDPAPRRTKRFEAKYNCYSPYENIYATQVITVGDVKTGKAEKAVCF
jgi:hypothetical protein